MYKDGKLITLRRRPNPMTTKMFRELLFDIMQDDFLEIFANTSKEDLITYHSSLGRHIRNTYIYPNKEFMLEYPDEHIDEISQEIIEEVHHMIHSLKEKEDDIEHFALEREIK